MVWSASLTPVGHGDIMGAAPSGFDTGNHGAEQWRRPNPKTEPQRQAPTMDGESVGKKRKNVVVVPMPHAVTEEGFFAVDGKMAGLKHLSSGSPEEVVFFGPRDSSYTADKYPVVFDKGEKIRFCSLYKWDNTISSVDTGLTHRLRRLLTFSRQLPCITWRLWKELPNVDGIVSTAVPYPPVGIMANVLGYLRGTKRTFWIDTDLEGFWEWQSKSASIQKALYLKLLKVTYSALVRFCVHTSQLTWASGDDVVSRYGNSGNVVKFPWASIPEEDAISAAQLEDKIARIQEGNLKLMTGSTLIPMKGVQYAVEAARILTKERGIPAILDIYGDGLLRQQLEHLVERYDLSDTVRFKGTVPYGPEFYACLREHDCIMIPDLPGPLSRTLFDALTQGIAVIASNTEAYKGAVSDGWDALLVPPGNPVEIAAAVERLHRDRKLLGQIIRNGAETGKRFILKSAL